MKSGMTYLVICEYVTVKLDGKRSLNLMDECAFVISVTNPCFSCILFHISYLLNFGNYVKLKKNKLPKS